MLQDRNIAVFLYGVSDYGFMPASCDIVQDNALYFNACIKLLNA